jgi:hypothetical protein
MKILILKGNEPFFQKSFGIKRFYPETKNTSSFRVNEDKFRMIFLPRSLPETIPDLFNKFNIHHRKNKRNDR